MYLRVLLLIFLSSVIFSWFLILLIVFSLNSSDKSSTSVITESSVGYINSTNWAFNSFLINNSNKCNNNSKDIKLLFLIHSSVTHFGFREVLRKHKVVDNSITVFLVGFLEDPGLQRLIEDESNRYGDLIQGEFYDKYENLTLKHIMGLTWATKYCSNAQLVLKMDDDIFVNQQLLNDLIVSRYPESHSYPMTSRTGNKLIAGYIQHKMKVIRNTTSRWFVSESDFNLDYYPDFCSGWAYITTIDVINDLLDQIPNHPLFWIDDVYITGILRQSLPDIELQYLNKLFGVDSTDLYLWITDTSLHRYKWKYVFSNANGDQTLLSAALDINEKQDQRVCCYPTFDKRVSDKQNSIELKPKSKIGFAKRISV